MDEIKGIKSSDGSIELRFLDIHIHIRVERHALTVTPVQGTIGSVTLGESKVTFRGQKVYRESTMRGGPR